MNASPGTVLALLAALALGVGGLLWGFSQRTQARLEGGAEASPPSSGEVAELREQVEFLETELQALRDENASLSRAAAELQEQLAAREAETPVTPAEIEEQVGEFRELAPVRPIDYRPVPRDEIADRIAADVRAGDESGDALRRRQTALVAMGWVLEPEFDLAASLVGLRENQEGTFFVPEDRALLYPSDAPLRNPTERGKLVEGIVRVLQRDHFDAGTALAPVADDADRTLARRALGTGDATQVKIRYNLMDQFAGDVPPPSPESQQQFYGAPVFLQQVSLFPYVQGARFVEVLQQEGGWPRVNEAYARPPRSTTEILHPELYLEAPPFVPEAVDLDRGAVAGREPLWTDVAGEYGIQLLFKTLLRPDVAESAAEGWSGDRWIVYPAARSEAPDEASIFWKTRWTAREEALEFADALRQFLVARYALGGVDPGPAEGVPELVVAAADGGRAVRLRLAGDGLGVTAAVALDDATADALESHHGLP